MKAAALQQFAPTYIDGSYTEAERQELEHYGVKFDIHGAPIVRTTEEAFGGLHQKLYEHFGEEYRTLLHAEYAKEGRPCSFL